MPRPLIAGRIFEWFGRPAALREARAALAGAGEQREAAGRQIERVLVQRWSRLAALGAVALLLMIGGRILTLGPDLAAGRPFRLSSTWSGFAACLGANGCHNLMLHTELEESPWVEIDLGSPRRVRRLEVFNRDDCCGSRATPLVAEVSVDRRGWAEVARSDRDFGSWKPSFPARVARFVRLRVPRRSVLHLQSIAVR